MLRLLAIAPLLLFATPLLAAEGDRLQKALSERVRLAERLVELAKTQKVNPRQPSAVLDPQVELLRARIDACSDLEERMKLRKQLVQVCGERMLIAQQADDDSTGENLLAEQVRFEWLEARLEMMDAAHERTTEGAGDYDLNHMRWIAKQALDAAKRREEIAEAWWEAGILLSEGRLRAVEDVFRAEMRLAENDADRRAALAERYAVMERMYREKKANFELQSRYEVAVTREAALRSRIALVLGARDLADEGTRSELERLRGARVREVMTWLLPTYEAQVDRGWTSVKDIDLFYEMAFNTLPDPMTPSERRVLFGEAEWRLQFFEKALQNRRKEDNAQAIDLELARLELLAIKLRIWDLRRIAAEPPPPKVFPGER